MRLIICVTNVYYVTIIISIQSSSSGGALYEPRGMFQKMF